MGKEHELMEAARNGIYHVVEKILLQKTKRSGPLASLRRGPGANVQDSSGYTALHHAALNGHRDLVCLLLSHEASTNIVDNKGSSPLHLASWSGNVDVVSLLLMHGPSIPNVNLLNKDHETALHCAAQHGHTKVVCLLLEHSCDANIRNTRQETALDLAAHYGRLDTVELLVRSHPELLKPYNDILKVFPHTPLHLASRNGHKFVVEVLLSAGMNVNVVTAAGSALHEAALCGKVEVVCCLLERGIDLCVTDDRNNTVLDLLKQFPGHIVREIYSIIKNFETNFYNRRSRASNASSSFDNLSSMKVFQRCGDYDNAAADSLSISSRGYDSPAHDRRFSGSISMGPSETLRAVSRSSNGRRYPMERAREFDTISICSTASSSSCSRAHRAHCCPLPSPGSLSHNKISPKPPKKPPRRNVSMSPSYAMPAKYFNEDYLYQTSRQRVPDNISDNVSDTAAQDGRYQNTVLRRGKSAENYIDGDFRHSINGNHAQFGRNSPALLSRGCSEDLTVMIVDDNDKKDQPIAITSVVQGNIPFRTTNPRRKLRRHTNESGVILSRGDLPFRKIDYRSPPPPAANSLKQLWPLSPTHYQQPPTPDHPPPSALQAEKRILDRIRPLSHEYNTFKRMSRDIDVGTEDETTRNGTPPLTVTETPTLTVPLPSNAPCKHSPTPSTDTNNIEEFLGTEPFEGLIQGGEKTGESREIKCEGDSSAEKKMLSPFDENEEWAKISEIMASFGSRLVRESIFVSELEQEFQNRLGLTSAESENLSVEEWLKKLGFGKLAQSFGNAGFDDINFINGVMEMEDLELLGVTDECTRKTLYQEIRKLPNKIGVFWQNVGQDDTVRSWLKSLKLDEYAQTFEQRSYVDLSRVKRLWQVELNAVMQISKLGHIRRIMASVEKGKAVTTPNTKQNISSTPQKEISTPKEEGNKPASNCLSGKRTVVRKNWKKSRPAPQPPRKVDETSAASNNEWRHPPENLIKGVSYKATYLGSTIVKEINGTDSTKKSIRKVKNQCVTNGNRSIREVILLISFQGVRFLEPNDKESICLHLIETIHCAYQDADDKTHFAYITKQKDADSSHCHVFRVENIADATDTILTLGQAFEVAYQIATKKDVSVAPPLRSQSVVETSEEMKVLKTFTPMEGTATSCHSRSYSSGDVLDQIIHPRDAKPFISPSKEPIFKNEDLGG